MYLVFCSLLIAWCVTHLYVQIISEQSVQVCDATMFYFLFLSLGHKNDLHIILFSNFLQDLQLQL